MTPKCSIQYVLAGASGLRSHTEPMQKATLMRHAHKGLCSIDSAQKGGDFQRRSRGLKNKLGGAIRRSFGPCSYIAVDFPLVKRLDDSLGQNQAISSDKEARMQFGTMASRDMDADPPAGARNSKRVPCRAGPADFWRSLCHAGQLRFILVVTPSRDDLLAFSISLVHSDSITPRRRRVE